LGVLTAFGPWYCP